MSDFVSSQALDLVQISDPDAVPEVRDLILIEDHNNSGSDRQQLEKRRHSLCSHALNWDKRVSPSVSNYIARAS